MTATESSPSSFAIGRSHPVVKVCGATSERDVEIVADAGADLVGLWYAIPGGRSTVDAAMLHQMAREVNRVDHLEPVLVTCSNDVEAIVAVAERSEIPWIQLHAYQPPATVAQLKSALPASRVIKVLHLSPDGCAEQPFIGRYELAGVDVFLVDVVTRGRIGSTGRALPPEPARRMLDQVDRPLMLAGGLSAANAAHYARHRDHVRYYGADFDTNARDESGRLQLDAIIDLTRGWGRPAAQLRSA